MVYLMGPSLDAELDYRRASLLQTGERIARVSRRARRAASRIVDGATHGSADVAAGTADCVDCDGVAAAPSHAA
jgi:hypothetical protein